MTTKIFYAPTITLYKVDIKETTRRYNEGYYVDPPSFVDCLYKVTLNMPAKSKRRRQLGVGRQTHIDVNGERIVTVLNNCNSKAKECYYCHLPFGEKPKLGYIIDIKHFHNCTEYFAEDLLCSPECILAWIDFIQLSRRERERIMELTLIFFAAAYPGKTFTKANDFRLLVDGSMTEAEWRDDKVKCEMIEGVVITHTSREYMLITK